MDAEGWLNIFCAGLERLQFRRGRARPRRLGAYPDIFKSEPVFLTTPIRSTLSHRRRPDSTIRIRRSES